ncbi:hypothetical protein KDL01_20495 [Actinospica durhamensis]|uniref:Bulb-type lectin domain-containing protein n=1 Tax=Actinospica durhamensis TaxID=1508375 RepID=A0A941EPR7_9ACTN|nr:hypothetical protein [Actinospica durhamensis]MBR7835667.1 hypothetical protein [Actinospica durhamensis]
MSETASDGYALVLRPGQELSRRAVSSPSGEYSVVHQHDGNVVVYRNADRFVVWAAGTDFQRAPVNPGIVPTDALDRVHGLPGRLALERDGNLVVYSSAGAALWASHTADRQVSALMIHDRGRLVLRSERGTIPWSSSYPPPRWDGWNRVGDGRVLRRGQCLRNASLVSADGAYVFVVGEGAGAFLCRTDGPFLWAVNLGNGEGFELTEDGRLVARAADGLERPADALGVSASTAAELAARGAARMLVTDDGRLAIADEAGEILWALEAPIVRRTMPTPTTPLRARRPRIPPGVPKLPVGEDVPVIRTDFSDDEAWRDALARVSARYEWHGDEPLSVDVTAIEDRRYAGLTAAQLAVLVPAEADWPMLVVADAQTMAAPARHLLLVGLDEDSLGPTVRATPAAVVEIAINLWMGNMDWEDFAGDPDYDTYDPDAILTASGIPEPE